MNNHLSNMIALGACESQRENEASDPPYDEGGECERCYEYTRRNHGNEDEFLCRDCGQPVDRRDELDRMGRTHS